MKLRKHSWTYLAVYGMVVMLPLRPEAAQQNSGASTAALVAAPRDGQHDFDFEIGTWKTHLSRLLHPLTGSHTWAERSEEHTSELQSLRHLVCRLLLEKKK